MSVAQFRNPNYLLINHAFTLHIYVLYEEIKSFTLLSARPSFIRVILRVAYICGLHSFGMKCLSEADFC